MIPLDLSGKVALVTGVADDVGFGWHIAKTLQAAGAEIILASHPRVVSIVERFLTRDKSKESRALPYGVAGEFKPKALLPCDVSIDTEAEVPAHLRDEKGYQGNQVSIAGRVQKVSEITPHVDILIHSVAFSPEIQKTHLEVSRQAYLTAMSVSSYSIIALSRAFLPLMKGRQGSVVGLTYYAAQRVVPFYGGGMAAAKAALECDARTLSWFLGEEGHRINLISAGPYASRAARSIGDLGAMIQATAERSPLRRAIEAEEVANATAFLCSPMSSAVTGQVLYVDAGYSVMGV